MRTNATKRVPFALILALTLALICTLGFTIYDGVTFAAEGVPTEETAITVGHMSDIHYFPLEYCYTKDVGSPAYKATDFYYAMTGDTKLVLESGIAFNAAIKSILADADDHKAPQYLVTSGDLCKNGERVALIDVANTLRYLQKEMRKKDGYENFQVFAVVGNHDLYNQDGEVYSKSNGEGRVADTVNAAQFALIFAGLGYPNATLDGRNGTVKLTDYLPAEYWSSNYTGGYQESANAENIDFHYYSDKLASVAGASDKMSCYYELGDDINSLTYAAELKGDTLKGYSFIGIDSADRIETSDGAPSRISESEYLALKEANQTPVLVKEITENGESVINMKHPVDSATAFNDDTPVYRILKYSHITGGRISKECLDWVQAYTETQTGSKTTLGEETYIATFHHNVLPHFEQEDDILKDFTLYNWEYTAKRFLNMGIRYALTGHMHASDVMTYTDVEGRTLYDFETGSTISYASPRRYLTFSRYSCDGKLGEKTESEVHILDNLKEVSDNITTTAAWEESLYTAYKNDPSPENWDALLEGNPEYLTYIIRHDELSSMSYNEFISKDIYSILVDRMVDHFISDRILDNLTDLVENVILGLDNSSIGTILGILRIDGETLNGAAQYIIDVVLNSLYGEGENDGYPYNGEKKENALEYVHAIINDVLSLKFGDSSIASPLNPKNKGKMDLRQIAGFIMMSHSLGAEISLSKETPATIARDFNEVAHGDNEYGYMQPTDRTYRLRMLAALKDMHNQLVSGKFVEDLLDILLDPLFNDGDSLLKTLVNHHFDLSEAVSKGLLDQDQYDDLKHALSILNDPILIGPIKNIMKSQFGISLPKNFVINIDAEDLCIGEIVDNLLPILKPLIADLMGFNMEGDSLIGIVENVLDSYVTPSFLVGLGGIADNIIMAFATDVYPDVKDMNHPEAAYLIQPYSGYAYGGVQMTYVGAKNVMSAVGASFNAATQDNGRVPSRVTANFDTKDSKTAYTIKFYTDEDVYGTFKLKTSADAAWSSGISVSTSKAEAITDNAEDYPYIDSVATAQKNGITVTMVTQTKPVYLPLIDLGLACLTHGEVEDDDDVAYIYGDRDKAAKNSVVYWNVTTVTVTGLRAGTTYYYDIEGSYKNDDETKTAQFSLAKYSKTKGYAKDYYTLTTAADASVTSFEFLTIADIQGMIQGMYDESYEAVKALLEDPRTKDFDFILNAGDMCDNGKNFNQWGYALNTYQELFANTSTFFTAGNHENGSNALVNYFNYTLPVGSDNKPLQQDTDKKDKASLRNGVYYSFNYANAHFVVLNTNDADGSGLGAVQYAWLENDLKNSNAKWKFVLMHKSLYSGGSHSTDAEVIAMRAQLVPLFDKYGVNIVFAGHDHTYTSTYLLDGKGNITDKSKSGNIQYEGDGVLYITLGTMGTKFYNYKENSATTSRFDGDQSILHTLDSQTFGKVVVDGDTLTFTGYYYNRETGSIEEINNAACPASNLNTLAIVLGVVIPVVAIAAVVVVLVVLKKKGVIGKKNAQASDVEEPIEAAPTQEEAQDVEPQPIEEVVEENDSPIEEETISPADEATTDNISD